MTEQHPITPPPELVQKWVAEIWHEGTPVRVALSDTHVAIQAARWGADTELEACCHCFARDLRESLALELRARRRPKPPNLAELALAALNEIEDRYAGPSAQEILVRRALECLQKLLENNG